MNSTFLEVEVSEGDEDEEAHGKQAVARVIGVENSVVYVASGGVILSPVLEIGF